MSARMTPAAVLDRLPGAWRHCRWRELDGGLTNTTWLLDNGQARAVLKFDPEPRGAPYLTRTEEGGVQAIAASAGLANRVLHAEEGLLLSEFVVGDVWRAESLHDFGNLEPLARALRRLHALPVSGRAFDAQEAARNYAGRINGNDDLVARCLAIAENRGSTPFSEKWGRTAVFCHNDLVAENILATPDIRFLDWEFACDNDPLFDLATIVEHHGLCDAAARHLLDAYGDGTTSDGWAALQPQRELYCALLWLWLASRPDSPQEDLDRAAERVLTSCS